VSEFLVSIAVLDSAFCGILKMIINSIQRCTFCEKLQLVCLMCVRVKYVAGADFVQDPSDVVMASR